MLLHLPTRTNLSSPKRPDRRWGYTTFYSEGTGVRFPVIRRPGVTLTTNLYLVPRLGIRGAKPLLPDITSLRGALNSNCCPGRRYLKFISHREIHSYSAPRPIVREEIKGPYSAPRPIVCEEIKGSYSAPRPIVCEEIKVRTVHRGR
jgi:hypothetical protein